MPSSQCFWAECTNTFTLLICKRDVAFTALLASIAWYVRNVTNTNGLGSDAVQCGGNRQSDGTYWRRWIFIKRHGVIFHTIDDYLIVIAVYVLSHIFTVRGMCDTKTRLLNWSLCPVAFFLEVQSRTGPERRREFVCFFGSCKFIVRSASCNISVFHVRVGEFNCIERRGQLMISDSGVWW
jgi:hypothetical protein